MFPLNAPTETLPPFGQDHRSHLLTLRIFALQHPPRGCPTPALIVTLLRIHLPSTIKNPTMVRIFYMLVMVKAYPSYTLVPPPFTHHLNLLIFLIFFMSHKSNKIYFQFKNSAMIIKFSLNFTLLFFL